MIGNKSILAIVPARGGSKGIKLKNIRPFLGIPLLGRVGQVIKQVPIIDRAIVSTDHPEIAQVARNYGIDVPFIRPKSISGDRVSDYEVLHHALNEVEKSDQKQYDIIVMLQPTSPLRNPKHVKDAIKRLVQGSYDSIWTVSHSDVKYHPHKLLTVDQNRMEYYDVNGENIIARQQLTPLHCRNGAAYVMTRECLCRQHTIKGKHAGVLLLSEPMVSIDTEYDLKFAEWLSKNYGEEHSVE